MTHQSLSLTIISQQTIVQQVVQSSLIMIASAALTVQQSPNQQFQTIDFSQQAIQQEDTIQPLKISKVNPEHKATKVYILKDKLRNKRVFIEIKIHGYRQQDSIVQDEKKLCRICLCDDGNSDLISPCQCKGSTGYIHENCLKTWLLEKQGIEKIYAKQVCCEICSTQYSMYTNFSNQRMIKLLCKADKGRIICWSVELTITFLLIGGIASLLILILNGRIDPLVLAGITVMFIFLILIIGITIISCIDQVTVEVLCPWKFINLKKMNDNGCDSRPLSAIDLENYNKQTIQPPSQRAQKKKYSSINVVQIQE